MENKGGFARRRPAGLRTYRLFTVDEAAAAYPIPRAIIAEWFEAAAKGGLFLKGKLWNYWHPDFGRNGPFISEEDLIDLVAARNEPRPQDVWKIPREALRRHLAPTPTLPAELR